jgi:hypothetical protein
MTCFYDFLLKKSYTDSWILYIVGLVNPLAIKFDSSEVRILGVSQLLHLHSFLDMLNLVFCKYFCHRGLEGNDSFHNDGG